MWRLNLLSGKWSLAIGLNLLLEGCGRQQGKGPSGFLFLENKHFQRLWREFALNKANIAVRLFLPTASKGKNSLLGRGLE